MARRPMRHVLILTLMFFFTACASNKIPTLPDVVPNPPLKEGTRLCIMGDAGNGSPDQYYVAKALEKENCNAILYAGDVIYEFGITSSRSKLFHEKFLSPYDKLIDTTPFYLVMGNHDWYLGNGDAWIDLNNEYDNIVYPHYFYNMEVSGDVCLIGLETNKKNMFKEQIDWAKKTLPEFVKECKFTIAIGHHPYYSAGDHGDSDKETKAFLDQTVMGIADVYVSGHDHNLSDEGTRNGTRLFVSGCGGKKRSVPNKGKGGWQLGDVVGYLVMEVYNGKAKFRFASVNKEKIEYHHSGEF